VIAEVEAPTLSAFDIVLRTIRQVDGVNLTKSSILLSTFVAPPLWSDDWLGITKVKTGTFIY
jgi:hypothetical protein